LDKNAEPGKEFFLGFFCATDKPQKEGVPQKGKKVSKKG
jgi:hypothetical protein